MLGHVSELVTLLYAKQHSSKWAEHIILFLLVLILPFYSQLLGIFLCLGCRSLYQLYIVLVVVLHSVFWIFQIGLWLTWSGLLVLKSHNNILPHHNASGWLLTFSVGICDLIGFLITSLCFSKQYSNLLPVSC